MSCPRDEFQSGDVLVAPRSTVRGSCCTGPRTTIAVFVVVVVVVVIIITVVLESWGRCSDLTNLLGERHLAGDRGVPLRFSTDRRLDRRPLQPKMNLSSSSLEPKT